LHIAFDCLKYLSLEKNGSIAKGADSAKVKPSMVIKIYERGGFHFSVSAKTGPQQLNEACLRSSIGGVKDASMRAMGKYRHYLICYVCFIYGAYWLKGAGL